MRKTLREIKLTCQEKRPGCALIEQRGNGKKMVYNNKQQTYKNNSTIVFVWAYFVFIITPKRTILRKLPMMFGSAVLIRKYKFAFSEK